MKQRNTIQKKLVLEAVSALGNHPTADEVYKRVAFDHPNISKGTVYRILNSLVQSDAILKLPQPDAAERFDPDTHLHYHLKCTQCGRFLDVELAGMNGLVQSLEKESGFCIDQRSIIFVGTCNECQKEQIGKDDKK